MLLDEDIAAVKKYYPNIDDDIFMQLISLDPTYRDGSNSVGKYGKWILNLFKKGAISKEDFSEITPLLQQFTIYKNRVQNKDLNAYKTLDDLSNTLAQVVDDDSMLSDRQKVRFLKNVKAGRISTSAEDDYDVVLDTPKFIVYVPNTHEASMKLGNGTEWCTAHENPDWYNNYTENGHKLYIIKEKKTGKLWQYSDKNGDFLNSADKKFSYAKLMKKDKDLSKFFSKFLGRDFYEFDGKWLYTGEKVPSDVFDLITDVTVASGVEKINSKEFYLCKSLKSVKIQDGVKVIESKAFYGCSKLKTVVIPSTVERIGSSAFCDCSDLSDVDLGEGVTYIGSSAFSKCGMLTDIIIPSSVTQIGFEAFSFTSLQSLVIPDNVRIIEPYAFRSCTNLKHVNLSNGLTTIDTGLFYGCSLESVELTDEIKSIQENAFAYNNIKSIVFPINLKFIKSNAFAGCRELRKALIRGDVNLSGYPFEACENLVVYTDIQSVIDYCNEVDISVKSAKEFKNESVSKQFKLRIAEDTACVASKTSYIDEDGLDKNGIYYFGKKPKPPVNWKDYKKDDIKNFSLKERSDRKMKLSIKESFADENGMFMQMDDAMSGLIGNVDDDDIDEVVRYYSTVSGKLGKKDKFSDIVCYFCSDSADVCDPIDSSKIYFGFKSIYKDRKFDSYVSSKYGDKFVIDHFNDNFMFTVYATNEDVINRLIDDLSNEYDNL